MEENEGKYASFNSSRVMESRLVGFVIFRLDLVLLDKLGLEPEAPWDFFFLGSVDAEPTI